MINIPGNKPFVPPPPITPKESKQISEIKPESQTKQIAPPPKESLSAPNLDARAIAVRMAALAHEAKEKEFSFEEIIQKAIDETGMTNPQSALEEANRKTQKEIEDTLDEIKSNKDLMEEAQAWEEFASILEKELSQEQVTGFLDLIKDSIRAIK
ncbi:hypothetical protein HZC34_00135 [Candidatus Saganbacteria bacterium]|nr:hypothetical protein [Candidatus Saganbacteria bacterium]